VRQGGNAFSRADKKKKDYLAKSCREEEKREEGIFHPSLGRKRGTRLLAGKIKNQDLREGERKRRRSTDMPRSSADTRVPISPKKKTGGPFRCLKGGRGERMEGI